MTLRITRLEGGIPIVTREGYPTQQFLRILNGAFAGIETAVNSLADTVSAIEAAQAAATAAQEAATTANEAAEAANTAATSANTAIADIEAGNFELEAVNVGGTRFINNGGVLEPEP